MNRLAIVIGVVKKFCGKIGNRIGKSIVCATDSIVHIICWALNYGS